MRTRTALSILTLPTLWLILSACGQTPTSAPGAQVPSAVAASTPATQVRSQAVTASAVTAPATQVVSWGTSYYGETTVPTLPAGQTYTAVAASGYFATALTSDGQVKAWGENTYGQTTVPTSLATQTTTALATGNQHVLALTSDGHITAWGGNYEGQTTVPALPGGQTYTAIAAGGYTSAALTSTGQVKVWGANALGQLDIPTSLSTATTTAIAVGGYFVLALTSGGQITAWGYNRYGQLDVPTLPAGTTYTAVAAGSGHSLALTSDGQVKAWGLNLGGQLNVPPLPAGTTYVAISANTSSSAALRSDGVIVTWGDLRYNGTPPAAPTGFHYTAISAGYSFGLAIARPDNTAPSAPGTPTVKAGTTPNNTGAFPLAWAASTDQESNPLTYTLEGKSSTSDATWTTVATGLTSPTYAPSVVPEGTWTYRVRANDGTVDGATSDASAAVIVDQTAPTAPTVQINGAAPTDGWYKDAANITVAGSTDPGLADGSAGSGVAGYQGAKTVTSSGTSSYSAAATDAAGNVSAATAGSVKVDATAPSVAFVSCPATVLLGSTQTLSWTAQDGQSGLAGAASGSVSIPTSGVGPQTLTTTAVDNVGHTTTVTCTTTVIYAFKGIQTPLNAAPALNVLAAGSAFPLKFSLVGFKGLGILAAGSPTIQPYTCAAGGPSGTAGPVALGTTTGLQYSASTDTYSYVGKAAKSMLGCYQVNVKLSDGTDHFVNILFK